MLSLPPVQVSPLDRGLSGSHRIDDHADGLDHDWGVVDHDVVSRVRVGDVHRAGHERRELVLGRRVRSVDDRSEVRRCIRRQLTGLDELRDDIDELGMGLGAVAAAVWSRVSSKSCRSRSG